MPDGRGRCGREHKVVTLGEAMLRMTPAEGERLERATRLDVHVAGAEANVAVGLAQLGVEVAWLSRVPSTPVGRRVVSDLACAGVDVAHVQWTDGGRLGIFYAEAGAAPRPARVWYDRSGSTFSGMTFSELDEGVLAGAQWAVLSGITPAVGSEGKALAERFAAAALAHHVALCVDVNYRSQLWAPHEARESLRPLLERADVVVCARRDAEVVFGLDGSDEEVLRSLSAQIGSNRRSVVLTLSDRGSLALDGDGSLLRQAAFAAGVVDRFGVGDAFVAGLIWGLLDTDLAGALRRASAVAALKCTLRGDQARVRPDDVRALLAGARVEVVR